MFVLIGKSRLFCACSLTSFADSSNILWQVSSLEFVSISKCRLFCACSLTSFVDSTSLTHPQYLVIFSQIFNILGLLHPHLLFRPSRRWRPNRIILGDRRRRVPVQSWSLCGYTTGKSTGVQKNNGEAGSAVVCLKRIIAAVPQKRSFWSGKNTSI